MNKNDEEYRADFVLHGFSGSPEEISEQIGLDSSSAEVAGRAVRFPSGEHGVAKENVWTFRSNLAASDSPDTHLKKLLDQMRPHKQQIIEIISTTKAAAYWSIWGYSYNESGLVGIVIEPKVLQEISEYGAGLEIDIYSLPKD